MQVYEIYSKWPNESIPPDVMALFPRDLTLNFTCSAVLFMAPNSIEELQITHLTSYLPYLKGSPSHGRLH